MIITPEVGKLMHLKVSRSTLCSYNINKNEEDRIVPSVPITW